MLNERLHTVRRFVALTLQCSSSHILKAKQIADTAGNAVRALYRNCAGSSMHNNNVLAFLRQLIRYSLNLFIQQLVFCLRLILSAINITQGCNCTLDLVKGFGIELDNINLVRLQHRHKLFVLVLACQN